MTKNKLKRIIEEVMTNEGIDLSFQGNILYNGIHSYDKIIYDSFLEKLVMRIKREIK